MLMSPKPKVSAGRFVDLAFAKHPLSYPHQKQRWLIRKDLVSLNRNFPHLFPQYVVFPLPPSTTKDEPITSTVPNSAALHLLCPYGYLHLNDALPPLLLTLILQPTYPNDPPLVFITCPDNAGSSIHPFLDPQTGAAITPYLVAWQHPASTLSDLVSNIKNIFSFWPINRLPAPLDTNPHQRSTASRMEASDRLSMQLLSDLAKFNSHIEDDRWEIRKVKLTLMARGMALTKALQGLEEEEEALRERVEVVRQETREVEEWLELNQSLKSSGDHSEAFEGVDGLSRLMLECKAADLAMDDVMIAMEKALEKGALDIEQYLKKLRSLAKDQFIYRVSYLKAQIGRDEYLELLSRSKIKKKKIVKTTLPLMIQL